MKKEEGYLLLIDIIDKERVHEDYKRVNDLADKYYKMKTGDGIESLLLQIKTRVTDEEFEQIKRIYRSVIPPTLNSTKMPYLKATRKEPNKKIDFESNAEERRAELEEYINTYWGDKSLVDFLEYAFVDYNYIDPNAFLITEFDEFDAKTEKAKPYPFIADSEQSIMYEYKNEILKYLVVRLPIEYDDNGVKRDGVKYTMYLGPDTIEFVQVKANAITNEGVEVIKIKEKYFEVFYYMPKSEVPAMRFGYLRDGQTKGRTFVSVFDCVVPLLEKTIKIDSELDLSTALVAFPQRFAYVTPCKNDGCNRGFMPDNTECPVCHGTGQQPFHTGTQDIVTLTLPRDVTQMIDLNNMLVYKSPDIALLQFDSNYLNELEKKIFAKMFNADHYTRTEVSVTATEKILDTDNLNDTLYQFGRQYSTIWKFVVRLIATFTDLSDGLVVTHQFPKDFKLKSAAELFTDLQLAKAASAATPTINAIQNDINALLYSDRPDELKKINIKNEIDPFYGYSESSIRFILTNGNIPLYQRTLYENLESIFHELELENEDPWIYDLAPDVIDVKVRAKTKEFMTRIASDKQAEYDKYVAEQTPVVPQG